VEALTSIYAARGQTDRIVIAPTGSKMQTVGVALFKAVVTDAQIVYPTPRSFASPSRYTEGVRQLYSLSLASFAALLPRMAKSRDEV
jgi:hypothetical protein